MLLLVISNFSRGKRACVLMEIGSSSCLPFLRETGV